MGRPKQIVLLRHAEKPDDDSDPHLSTRGRVRAAALGVSLPSRYGAPDALFATSPSKRSVRPIETLTPLSQTLQLTIRQPYADNEFQALAGEILNRSKYAGESIVICWHHGAIPDLARALLAMDVNVWEASSFDKFWVLTYAADGTGQPVKDEPQQLLFGDRPAPA